MNIEGGLGVFINTTVLETNGAATTFSAETSMLLTSPEISATGGAVTVNGAATVQIGGGTCEVTGLSLLTLTTVGELNIAGGVTTVETGAFTAATGVCLWTAPTFTLAGGNVNVGGVLTTLNAASLAINNSVGTVINSPVTTINSVTTTIAATRTLQVDNIEPTTSHALSINDVDAIQGRPDTGMTVGDIKYLTGNGSGMDITNIANFENYSATNVLIQNQQLYQSFPTILLNGGYQLAFTSSTKVWQYPNIPQLCYTIQVNGRLINNVGTAGMPLSIFGYIAIKNLTRPATLPLPDPIFQLIGNQSIPGGLASSLYQLNYTVPYLNNGSHVTNAESYQIQLYLANGQATPAVNTVSFTVGYVQVNAQISQAL